MRTNAPPSARLGAVAFLILAACSSETTETADLWGWWEGLVRQDSTNSPTAMSLTQSGADVAGTLGGMALIGKVHGRSVSFEVSSGGFCAVAGKGSGTVTALADRDRFELSWFGADSCGGKYSSSGTLERLRCAPKSLCGTGLPGGQFCADIVSDPANCGQCGLACSVYQTCQNKRCALPACTGPVPLEAPRRTSAGAAGPALAVADMNGDGAQDLVLAGGPEWPRGRMAVLLGDGRGGFGAPTLTSLPVFVYGFALGDVDGDGTLDAVVHTAAGTQGPAAIQVLHGNGHGSFSPAASYPAEPRGDRAPHRSVALVDLDGDGALDIVISAESGGEVRRGAGDGTFGPGTPFALAGRANGLVATDIDGDGHPDVVVVGADPRPFVSVLLGRGNGTLEQPIELAGVAEPLDVAVSDLDGDGWADIVVSGGGDQYVAERVVVHFGRGNRTFAEPVGIAQDGWDWNTGVAIADLNHDGRPDVAVAASFGGAFLVFPTNADGTFGTGVRFPLEGGAESVAVADLDGDGAPELVVASWSQEVSVLHSCRR